MYLATDDVVFNEYADVQLQGKDQFFVQFQGDLNAYKDNNNYLRINTVTARNERIKIWTEPKIYEFIDYT